MEIKMEIKKNSYFRGNMANLGFLKNCKIGFEQYLHTQNFIDNSDYLEHSILGKRVVRMAKHLRDIDRKYQVSG